MFRRHDLSLAILIGLAANAILGLWWADPLVALIARWSPFSTHLARQDL